MIVWLASGLTGSLLLAPPRCHGSGGLLQWPLPSPTFISQRTFFSLYIQMPKLICLVLLNLLFCFKGPGWWGCTYIFSLSFTLCPLLFMYLRLVDGRFRRLKIVEWLMWRTGVWGRCEGEMWDVRVRCEVWEWDVRVRCEWEMRDVRVRSEGKVCESGQVRCSSGCLALVWRLPWCFQSSYADVSAMFSRWLSLFIHIPNTISLDSRTFCSLKSRVPIVDVKSWGVWNWQLESSRQHCLVWARRPSPQLSRFSHELLQKKRIQAAISSAFYKHINS